jgi:DNA-binding transcriptional MerR regulator
MSMMKVVSSGQAAKEIGVTRDSLLFALRTGAPEPKAGRLGNRRMFSEDDIETLKKWFARRRSGTLAGAAI